MVLSFPQAQTQKEAKHDSFNLGSDSGGRSSNNFSYYVNNNASRKNKKLTPRVFVILIRMRDKLPRRVIIRESKRRRCHNHI
jgi:hypothetical protein